VIFSGLFNGFDYKLYLCIGLYETEAGTAGEQPVSDIFDLYSFIKKRDCLLGSPFL